ncbi:MAG: group III truncated hemoglobin [Alphaproteobacteria bacterium]
MNDLSKRERTTAEVTARTGIDEAVIERVVRSFYLRVQEDKLLRPVFNARIVDWESHLQRMFSFWHSVALMSGTYKGRPMEKHLPLPIDANHFDRWLELFEETARATCEPGAADHFVSRARTIAESLEFGIAAGHGVVPAPGKRYLMADTPD